MANPQLTVDAITLIATEVALEHSPPVRVFGTVLTTPGSEFVEIVVNIEDVTSWGAICRVDCKSPTR